MTTLYRIGDQDCCHHIIRAAVAAGVITEIKPGAGLVAATSAERPLSSMAGPASADEVCAVAFASLGHC